MTSFKLNYLFTGPITLQGLQYMNFGGNAIQSITEL